MIFRTTNKMKNSPYSKTSLAKKLGIKPNFKIRLINPPANYFDLFTDMPENIELITDKTIKKDLIHYFATDAKDIQASIVSLKNEIKQNGIIWISWYKKAANIATDVTEDFIRNTALANGLVDIKICAVDELWSGLKLVIPVKNRVRN
jgi:hypothetical protein